MENEDHQFIAQLRFPDGRMVEVGVTVTEDPLFPTPGEPDITRAPALHEWPDICHKLATNQFTILKPQAPAMAAMPLDVLPGIP